MNFARCARQLKHVAAAVAIIAIGATAAGCKDIITTPPGTGTTASTISATATATSGAQTSSQASQSNASQGPAIVLPLTGLDRPAGVAVDISGAVYVTDGGNNRVVKLAANSYAQTVLPFTGLKNPGGVAVDGGSNVYVTDADSNRVMWAYAPRATPAPPWQAGGSDTEWVGPFSGLQAPHGTALVAGQIFFVADSGNNRVLKWTFGTNAPEVLAITGLNNPDGVALNSNAAVWVADTGNNRVVHLDNGNSVGVLPFTGLNGPHGVALYNLDVYVADTGNNRVLKLTTDPTTKATTQSVLPFTGLNNPRGVTVDSQGNVYVVDTGNNRVLKLEKSFAGQ
jgi:sugar lactone lactonase YvrE